MRFSIRIFVLILSLAVFALNIAAQDKPFKKTGKTVAKNTGNKTSAAKPEEQSEEKAQAALDDAKATADVAERIAKLKKFVATFSRSELRIKAAEMLVVSHVEAGENSFRSADNATGAEHFRNAVKAFEPEMSDGIFNDIIAKLPFNLFFRNERAAALAAAKEVEAKVNDNAPRLLTLANFYLTTENATEGKRLAARAAEVAPDLPAPHLTLGMAHRIGFQLEAASQAYARALELDATSTAAKRNLADAWRGLGQNEDALKLYRELIEANPSDEQARNGLILSLLSTEQKEEAEKELATALEQNPKNIVLQTSAAYWYAANGDGKRAVELAQKAVETEPRYVWGQIALARGLVLEKRPLEAERALLVARQYGNFPTLDYELANARVAAGFYEEAAEDLRRAFAIKNGKLETRLAGRADAQADNFIELLSRERRASIFQPTSASSEAEANKLKELLAFSSAVAENADETALTKTAQDFAVGDDEMSTHRQLYAANKLLNRKTALPQVLDLTVTATNGLEKSLDFPAATAAVLAEELYEPRRLAQTRGSLVNVPEIPRATLRQIMRGRVEEIAGWTLFQQNKPDEAVVRLRRAAGVLPPNSAWWRSSYWKLGAALEASGKPKDALDAYTRSYRADAPNETRRLIIEGLYRRVFGSLDGLEDYLSGKTTARKSTAPEVKPAPSSTFRNPLPNVIAKIVEPTATPAPKAETSPTPEPTPVPTPEPSPETTPTPEIKTETTPTPEPAASPSPEIKTEEKAVEKVEEKTEVTKEIIAEPTPTPEVKPETTPTPEAVATPAPTPEIKAEPEVQPSPTPETKVEQPTEPEVKPEKKTEEIVTAEPVPTPENKPASETPKETKPEEKEAVTESPQTLVATEIGTPEEKPEVKPEEKTEEKKEIKDGIGSISLTPVQKEETAKVDESELGRPRIITRNVNGQNPTPETENTEKPKPSAGQCVMKVNQRQLSLLRNGGVASLLVIFENAADAEKLTVTSDSPGDISIALQPDEEKNTNRRLFQITSISEFTKTFTVFVESSCGKEEVKVRVR